MIFFQIHLSSGGNSGKKFWIQKWPFLWINKLNVYYIFISIVLVFRSLWKTYKKINIMEFVLLDPQKMSKQKCWKVTFEVSTILKYFLQNWHIII